ncbi:hypothetical protein HF325_005596 [Metschnikowia pulcherrima]|uniref:Uncharacterized protein n=1 Tax=Metschnikowia pulcherrima TaxID=27326 RepID=A0A8H7GMM3_9ASCO|nr:hypothetical protein HF325_005596 [Metschnikowia pulcherrima]
MHWFGTLRKRLRRHSFCAVPSENVLQVLFTLCARCAAQNWSHDALQAVAGSTSDYMKQVSRDYVSALGKATLQHRSTEILQLYLSLIYSDGEDEAVMLLKRRLRAVLATLHKINIMLYFLAQKGVFTMQPLARIREPRRAKAKAHDVLEPPAPLAVEVISDSEDSDSIIDAPEVPEIALKYHLLELPQKQVSLFSEIGTNTSGLGESASLFTQMSHHQTENAHTQEEPASLECKRPKVEVPGWKRIRVFDDATVLHKLLATANYDVWNLLKWTFWCADTNSQYQKFLFNSTATHLHLIYRANFDFLMLFFGLGHADLLETLKENKLRSAVISLLLLTLGPKLEWHDRATEYVFAGLGVPTHDKPYPLYNRELLLTRNDPTVLNPRCKTARETDDNMHSMHLRVRILLLMFEYETVLSDGWFTAGNSAGYMSLLGHVVRVLHKISLPYIKHFLTVLQLFINTDAASVQPKVRRKLSRLAVDICLGMLNALTDRDFTLDNTKSSWASQVADMILDERVVQSMVDDETFKSIEDFEAYWQKVMFLAEWLFEPRAKKADQLAALGWDEYLEKHTDEIDLLPDGSFTLTREQIEQWKIRKEGVFAALATHELGPISPDMLSASDASWSGLTTVVDLSVNPLAVPASRTSDQSTISESSTSSVDPDATISPVKSENSDSFYVPDVVIVE